MTIDESRRRSDDALDRFHRAAQDTIHPDDLPLVPGDG